MKKQITKQTNAKHDLDPDGSTDISFESRHHWTNSPYTGNDAIGCLWTLRLQLSTAAAALGEVLKAAEKALDNNPTGKAAVDAIDDIEEQLFTAKDLYFDQGLFVRFGE